MSRPPRPAPSEGEINISVRREAWQERNLGVANRAICERDAEAFVHQSVSSPCLTAVKRAEGIWVEDFDGRRYMDFHGNSVHHIGYGHPRLKAAIAPTIGQRLGSTIWKSCLAAPLIPQFLACPVP